MFAQFVFNTYLYPKLCNHCGRCHTDSANLQFHDHQTAIAEKVYRHKFSEKTSFKLVIATIKCNSYGEAKKVPHALYSFYNNM